MPGPRLIGPEVKRRQSMAPPPPSDGGAISSAVHESGAMPATSSGGLTVSGGYSPLSGLAGATNVNSYGGTVRRFGSSARRAPPVKRSSGSSDSSLARRRNDARVTASGRTRTVQRPPAGASTSTSELNWLALLSDPARAPCGSKTSTTKVSRRSGVSMPTRRRRPPSATSTANTGHGAVRSHKTPSGTRPSSVPPSQNQASSTARIPSACEVSRTGKSAFADAVA